MSEIFFTSDTHFLHDNILKFDGGRKEFQSVNEMNETMVQRWNSVVGVQDKIYHLGDVTFKYNGEFNDLMSRLRGRKRLVVGNHDSIKNVNLQHLFEKIDLWTGGKFKHLGFIGSHMPLHPDHFKKYPLNVHGHTHRNLVQRFKEDGDGNIVGLVPDPRYMNVCVEQTGYTPIHIDEIIKRVKELAQSEIFSNLT